VLKINTGCPFKILGYKAGVSNLEPVKYRDE